MSGAFEVFLLVFPLPLPIGWVFAEVAGTGAVPVGEASFGCFVAGFLLADLLHGDAVEVKAIG
ncbi:hypothetical protein [Actinoplanes lobatus]|uniref:Uncharacterized protein n=1 Tax=Actinoplanes lobatus TaxID=113568 RepID=A0A7W7HNL2_9ACTN|nr:hypothetical protein [Actinoplanes lobatus]MBB4753821.1 hypothetical protein [Actinoplanes lobatus]